MSEIYEGIFGSNENRRAPCPECEKETRVATLFEKLDRWDDPQSLISGVEERYVFQCKGCDAIFYATASGNSEGYGEYMDEDGNGVRVGSQR